MKQATAAGLAELVKPAYYRLDREKLEPGDIVIIGSNNPVHLLIRTATRQDYAHAGLYIGSGFVAESTIIDGAMKAHIGKFNCANRDALAVVRLRPDVADRSEKIKRILAYVNEHVLDTYNLRDAVTLPLRRAGVHGSAASQPRNSSFCSEFVAKAYAEAGEPIRHDKGPRDITPGDIVEMSQLAESHFQFVEEAVSTTAFPIFDFEHTLIENTAILSRATKTAVRAAHAADACASALGDVAKLREREDKICENLEAVSRELECASTTILDHVSNIEQIIAAAEESIALQTPEPADLKKRMGDFINDQSEGAQQLQQELVKEYGPGSIYVQQLEEMVSGSTPRSAHAAKHLLEVMASRLDAQQRLINSYKTLLALLVKLP